MAYKVSCINQFVTLRTCFKNTSLNTLNYESCIKVDVIIKISNIT